MGKEKVGKEKVEKGKSGNNETFVIHTKECSTGQIMGEEKMGGLKGKMGEREKRGRGRRRREKNGRKKRGGKKREN